VRAKERSALERGGGEEEREEREEGGGATFSKRYARGENARSAPSALRRKSKIDLMSGVPECRKRGSFEIKEQRERSESALEESPA